VLRAAAKEPATLVALVDEIALARGADPRLDRAIDEVRAALGEMAGDPEAAQYVARRTVERLAVLFQASLVVRHSPQPVADAFVASRVAGGHGNAFGTLPRGIDCEAIIERHRPRLAG